MTSRTAERFRKAFKDLPKSVQQQARKAYKLFSQNPYHSSLHFKQIHPQQPIYSVRIDRDYRAVGVRNRDEVVWFWIGSHKEYDKLISHL
jgi:mRNA-degrading endonuclease RelE of RelBE toxin-antitoxin system